MESLLGVEEKKGLVALFPQIIGVSVVTASIVIYLRQFAGKDGIVLEYFVIIARRRQIRRIEICAAVVEPDARQLVFVETNGCPCNFQWGISHYNKELLNYVAGSRTLLPEETFVNHRLELIQHLAVLQFCEFLFLAPQPTQLSLNFSYSVFNFGGSKSFV